MAKSIALHAIKPKPLSVWEVLIPIVFIVGYMKSRTDRDVFAQNLLFTKKLALKAAFDMLKKDLSREAVLKPIHTQTDELLASLPANVYSEKIRNEQLREIDVLIDHYHKLLTAEGHDFAALVLRGYTTKEAYASFQHELSSAEKQVTLAARRALGADTDSVMVARIEAGTDSLRKAEAEKIFGTDSQPGQTGITKD